MSSWLLSNRSPKSPESIKRREAAQAHQDLLYKRPKDKKEYQEEMKITHDRHDKREKSEKSLKVLKRIKNVIKHALKHVNFDDEENKRWKSYSTNEEKLKHLAEKLDSMTSSSGEIEVAIERLCSQKCRKIEKNDGKKPSTKCEKSSKVKSRINDVISHALEHVKFDEEEDKKWKSYSTNEEKLKHLAEKLDSMTSSSGEIEVAIDRLCSQKCRKIEKNDGKKPSTKCEKSSKGKRRINDVISHALEHVKFDEEEDKRWKSYSTNEEKIKYLIDKLDAMESNSAETEAAIERLCSQKCKKTPRKSIKTSPSINLKLSSPKQKQVINEVFREVFDQFQDVPNIFNRPKHPRKCKSKRRNDQIVPFRKLFKTAALLSKAQSSCINSRSARPQTSPQLLCPKVSLYNRPTTIHENSKIQELSDMLKSKSHKTPFTKDQTISIPSKLPTAQPPTKLNVPTISRSPSPLNQNGKSLKKSKIPLLINPTTNRPKSTQQRSLASQRNLTALSGKSLDFGKKVPTTSTPSSNKPKSTVISKNTKLCQPSQQPENVKKPPVSKTKQPTKLTQQPTNLNRKGALPTKQVSEKKEQIKAPSYSLTKIKLVNIVSEDLSKGSRVTQVSNRNVKNFKYPKKPAMSKVDSGNLAQKRQAEEEEEWKKRFVFKIPSLALQTTHASYPLNNIIVSVPKKNPSKNVSYHKSRKSEGDFSRIFPEHHAREANLFNKVQARKQTEYENLQDVKDTNELTEQVYRKYMFDNIMRAKDYYKKLRNEKENNNK